MGDRTNLNLLVKDLGGVEHAAVREAVLELFTDQVAEVTVNNEDTATGAWTLSGYDAALESYDDLARQLRVIISDGIENMETGEYDPIPDFRFRLWTEPKYEFSGSLVIHVPDQVEDFEVDCNADGTPTPDPDRLLGALRGTTDARRIISRVEGLLGKAHQDAFDAVPAPTEYRVEVVRTVVTTVRVGADSPEEAAAIVNAPDYSHAPVSQGVALDDPEVVVYDPQDGRELYRID